MPFTSIDDIINKMTTDGQTSDFVFQKTYSGGGSSAAGRWHEMLTWTGVPAAVSFTGTAGVATTLTSATTGALSKLAEGDISPETRHLLNAMAYTSSSVITPASMLLCDFLQYYPANVVTGSPTTLDNTTTLTRYTNGKGVMAGVFVQTALGAASPALTITFTADDDSSQSAIMTSPANSAPISTAFLNNGQALFPIPNGKVGVKKIDSYTIASGTTGTVAFVLFRPLMQIPLMSSYSPSERDCLFQLLSLPEIKDDACLGFMVGIGATMSTNQTIGGRLQYIWS